MFLPDFAIKTRVFAVVCRAVCAVWLLWPVATALAKEAPTAVLEQAQPQLWHIVAEVKDGKSLVLDTGKTVRLVNLYAPKIAYKEGMVTQPLAEEAKAHLQSLVEGKQLRLEFATTKEDRYGRYLAQLYTKDGTWVQGEMVSAGMAMVYSFPDNVAQVPKLLQLEQDARAAKRGIWALPDYAVLRADEAEKGMEQFRLVEGVVQAVADVRGALYINFGENWREDFTLYIAKKNRTRFESVFPALERLEGKRMLARGWIFFKNGAMIELTHPEQVKLLAM